MLTFCLFYLKLSPAFALIGVIKMNISISDMSTAEEMYVVKRSGLKEPVAFEKVVERLRKSAEGLHVNVTAVAQKVLAQIVNGINTSELDVLSASLSISNVTVNPDYGVLAANVIISNHQKNTPYTFASIFIAQAYNIPLDLGTQLTMLLVLMLTNQLVTFLFQL